MLVKETINLNEYEVNRICDFLSENEKQTISYQSIEFSSVIDNVFNYTNYSLVAFDDNGDVVGYLPQWKKGAIIESVPWRDKGGPVCSNEETLLQFIKSTKHMVHEGEACGFIWRDFQTDFLDNYTYFINVDVDLEPHDVETYWSKIGTKVRGKVKQARKNGLLFKAIENVTEREVRQFYNLFLYNRKKFGVPVYPVELFKSYFNCLSSERITLFHVYKNEEVVGSLIMLHDRYKAIDAYSASSREGIALKANDFLIYNMINYCIEHGIQSFDFGADSPLQESLIQYKLKWLGKKRAVVNSFYGKVQEIDHNEAKYKFLRRILTVSPMWFYKLISRLVVR